MYEAMCIEDGCERSVVARGLCRSHYGKANYAGRLAEYESPKRGRPSTERFLSHVPDRPGVGCWLWGGFLYPSGYGQFWLNGRNMTAHRAAFELFVAPIPAGAVVCHRCDVKACVRPDHLFAGPQALNIADKVEKDHQAKGVDHGSAVLTEEQVRMIRTLREAGHGLRPLAQTFGVTKSTVHAIVTRKSWKHLD